MHRPEDWGPRLVILGRMFGKTPREIAQHPWSELNAWIEWSSLT